ncbi:hypothetical protein F6B41_34030 [Microbacterium lushaniae]|nr:hypothetical protein F6B41_34030 [Microbacterium lushaniae]
MVVVLVVRLLRGVGLQQPLPLLVVRLLLGAVVPALLGVVVRGRPHGGHAGVALVQRVLLFVVVAAAAKCPTVLPTLLALPLARPGPFAPEPLGLVVSRVAVVVGALLAL